MTEEWRGRIARGTVVCGVLAFILAWLTLASAYPDRWWAVYFGLLVALSLFVTAIILALFGWIWYGTDTDDNEPSGW